MLIQALNQCNNIEPQIVILGWNWTMLPPPPAGLGPYSFKKTGLSIYKATDSGNLGSSVIFSALNYLNKPH